LVGPLLPPFGASPPRPRDPPSHAKAKETPEVRGSPLLGKRRLDANLERHRLLELLESRGVGERKAKRGKMGASRASCEREHGRGGGIEPLLIRFPKCDRGAVGVRVKNHTFGIWPASSLAKARRNSS